MNSQAKRAQHTVLPPRTNEVTKTPPKSAFSFCPPIGNSLERESRACRSGGRTELQGGRMELQGGRMELRMELW
jgi:hypothetical protein